MKKIKLPDATLITQGRIGRMKVVKDADLDHKVAPWIQRALPCMNHERQLPNKWKIACWFDQSLSGLSFPLRLPFTLPYYAQCASSCAPRCGTVALRYMRVSAEIHRYMTRCVRHQACQRACRGPHLAVQAPAHSSLSRCTCRTPVQEVSAGAERAA